MSMTDNDILQMYDTTDKLKKKRKTIIQERFPEIYEYLVNRFPDLSGDESIAEIVYRIRYKLEKHPTCVICGTPLNFSVCKNKYPANFCSKQCEHSKEGALLKREKSLKTKLERYGDPNYNNREKYKQTNIERFGYSNPNMNHDIKTKAKQKREKTIISKYGVKNVMFVDKIKEKVKQTNKDRYHGNAPICDIQIKEKTRLTNIKKYGGNAPAASQDVVDKMKQTCVHKYGVENPMQNAEIKSKAILTCKDKYGVENPMQNAEIKSKAILTCKDKYGTENPMQVPDILNKSFINRFNNSHTGTSKIEDSTYNFIINEIDDKCIRQYTSDLYPFHCDFYLPKYELYLELNGCWTHNDHPFDPDNTKDIDTLNKWKEKSIKSKFYETAIHTWTISDPLKRNTAKNNGINFLEIFSNDIEDVSEKLNNYIYGIKNV